MAVITAIHYFIHLICAISRDHCTPLNPPVKPEVTSYTSNSLLDTSIPPIVHTKSGGVEGYYMTTIRNRRIAAFEGIQYGIHPIGELRFRISKPVKRWEGIRKAIAPGPVCLQMDQVQYYRVYGQEDCLYLNVYTPKINITKFEKGLPILFFIHGGGHAFGSGQFYGPSYLLDKQDVILVTFNARLGILGYLSTGDHIAPGNYGLKDDALALEWIRDNAKAFGGDPGKITVWGQSAGGSGAGLHLMSKRTRGIPWAAIMQSGQPLHHWAIVNSTIQNSRIVAESFGCPTSSSSAMVDCLRKQDANFIVEHQWRAYKVRIFPLIPFGPVVEPPGEDAFLDESPEMAYENGNVSNVPVLAGLVQNEGDFFTSIGFIHQLYGLFQRDWLTLGLLALDIDTEGFPPEYIKEQALSLRKFYFPNDEKFTFWTRGLISRGFGDRYMANGVRKGLEWHSKIAPTYAYLFSYRGKHSMLESLGLNRRDWGVSHIDDLQYIFNSTLTFKPLRTSDDDFQIVEFITNVWGNFAAKRVPVFTSENGTDIKFWDIIDPLGELKLLEINKDKKMISYPFEERYQKWKSVGIKDDYRNSRFENNQI